jgi:hypothetical protein
MSFLTSLIQRHTPAAQPAQSPPHALPQPSPLPALQPRLPARFEPLAPYSPSPRNARDSLERDEMEDAPATLRANGGMTRQPPPHNETRATTMTDAPMQRLAPQVSAIHSALDAGRSTIQPAQPVAPAASNDSVSQSLAVRALARASADAMARMEAPASHRSPIGVTERRTRQPNTPATDQRAIDARAQKPVIRPEVRLAPPAHSTVSERERAEADLPAEPVVHVTIGRVEVRAVLPGAPPARPAQTPPRKSSLEDYLRGRKGGGP